MLNALLHALSIAAALQQPNIAIRVNQVGYLPEAPKVAVACALQADTLTAFTVVDLKGRRAFGPARATASGAFGPCVKTWRLDFSGLNRRGDYIVVAGTLASPQIRIADDVYRGAADTLLLYM